MLVEFWLVLVTLVAAAVWYSRWRFSYWASMGIPTVPTLPFIGDVYQNFRMPTWIYFDKIYKNHGGSKMCGRYEGFKPVLFVGDPDILRGILVKDFDHFADRRIFGTEKDDIMREMMSNRNGDEWKILRSIMSPTFSSGKMKKMFHLVCDKADLFVSSCLNDAAKNPAIDLKDKSGRFTMDTIASCAFGIECNSFSQEKPEFALNAEKFFSMGGMQGIKMILMLMLPKLANAIGLQMSKTETDFFTEVATITMKSREGDRQRGDFLDLMLEARDEENDSNSSTSANHAKSFVMSEKTIVAQSVLFLIAGYDTSASTLAFASHQLALNPKEQQRLREELQELVKREGKLTYQGVMEAKLLDACVQETLRLCPPATMGERACTKPYKIPGTEVTLRPGDVVQFPFWSLHRDPRYWPEPEKFQPDRFMPENKASIKHFTHMPFGMGPRNCLAMRFALMEVKIALAKLVMAAELGVAEGHEEITFDRNAFMLRPKKGTKLILTPLSLET